MWDMIASLVLHLWSSLTARHIVALNPVQPKDGIMLPAVLWNDTSCLAIMSEKAKKKFKRISYGPYKSDLCRLYVMYEYGGVYTDNDIWLLKYPQAPPTHLLIRESPKFKPKGMPTYIMNAFMVSPPREPLFLRAIDIMLESDENDSQIRGLWGPWALHMANPANFTIVNEKCKTWSPCSCGVSGLFKSHVPCRY